MSFTLHEPEKEEARVKVYFDIEWEALTADVEPLAVRQEKVAAILDLLDKLDPMVPNPKERLSIGHILKEEEDA